MNRFLFDTNVLIYLITGQEDEICAKVQEILDDYHNLIYTSAISIAEVIQLFRIGKIRPKGYKNVEDLIKNLPQYNIEILSFTEKHALTMAKLSPTAGHNDPFDHAIISQAITDKITLVSSDRKFKDYTSQHLKFVFNKR